jgi:hypothetical protein
MFKNYVLELTKKAPVKLHLIYQINEYQYKNVIFLERLNIPVGERQWFKVAGLRFHV